MSQSNYPPGSALDPNAPYNEKPCKMSEHEPEKFDFCYGPNCDDETLPAQWVDHDKLCAKCFQPTQIEEDADDWQEDDY